MGIFAAINEQLQWNYPECFGNRNGTRIAAPRNIFEVANCVASEFNVTNMMMCEGRLGEIKILESMSVNEYYATLEALIIRAQKNAEEIEKATSKHR